MSKSWILWRQELTCFRRDFKLRRMREDGSVGGSPFVEPSSDDAEKRSVGRLIPVMLSVGDISCILPSSSLLAVPRSQASMPV